MRLAGPVALLAVALTLSLASVTWAYSPTGAFVWDEQHPPDTNTVLTWPNVVRDHATGLPKVVYSDGKAYWNPLTVSLWALQEFNRYKLHHRKPCLPRAEKAGNWLIQRQRTDGTWRLWMPFSYLRLGPVSPGWVAAQAQGNAISLLVRLYGATHKRRFLHAAIAARAAYQRSVSANGVRRSFDGHVFFEGFPTQQPALTLEDFQLSILALYDLSRYDAPSRRLWRTGMKTLTWALPLYEGPDGQPQYDLAHRTADVSPYYDASSHRFNAGLLRLLSKLSGSRVAAKYAAKWLAELAG